MSQEQVLTGSEEISHSSPTPVIAQDYLRNDDGIAVWVI